MKRTKQTECFCVISPMGIPYLEMAAWKKVDCCRYFLITQRFSSWEKAKRAGWSISKIKMSYAVKD